MALEKTWQYDQDRAVADFSTVAKLSASFWWGMLAFMRGVVGGATQGLWTCVQSCDSITVKTDGTDLQGDFFDSTKWVRAAAGVAHSWRVDYNASLGIYLITDWSGVNDQAPCVMGISFTAPTGGTTTARPTSTTEAMFAAVMMNDNTATASRLHCAMATDGQVCIQFSKNLAGFPHRNIHIFPAADLQSGDSYGVFMLNCAYASSINNVIFLTTCAASTVAGRTWNGASTTGLLASTHLDYGARPIVDTQSSIGDYNTSTGHAFQNGTEIQIWDNYTGNAGGRRGRLVDIMVTSKLCAQTNVYPATYGGAQERAQAGCFSVPALTPPTY
jgi:hypothetical protein